VSSLVLFAGIVTLRGVFAVFARRNVSIIPIVPFFPAVLLVVGIGVNAWKPWAGTIAIGALHVVVAVIIGLGAYAERRQDRDEGGD